ncbi:MAG: hypothetical protein AB7S36_06535, partial [Planctomycetota bacterium]
MPTPSRPPRPSLDERLPPASAWRIACGEDHGGARMSASWLPFAEPPHAGGRRFPLPEWPPAAVADATGTADAPPHVPPAAYAGWTLRHTLQGPRATFAELHWYPDNLRFSDDNHWLFARSGRHLLMFHFWTGRLVARFAIADRGRFAVSPDATRLLITAPGSRDARCVDPTTGTAWPPVQLPHDRVHHALFTRDDRRLIVASPDGELLELALDGRLIRTLASADVDEYGRSTDWSTSRLVELPDGRILHAGRQGMRIIECNGVLT